MKSARKPDTGLDSEGHARIGELQSTVSMTLPPTVGSAPLEGLTFGTRDMVQAGHSKCREMLRSLASQTRMQFGDCLRGGWALHLNNSAPLLSAWEERIETDTNILVFRMMDLGHSIAACLFRYLARNVAMLSQIWRFNEPHFTSKHQLKEILGEQL